MPRSHLWVRCRTCTCGHTSWRPLTSTAWPPAAATLEGMSSLGPTQRWSFVEASQDIPLTPVTERPQHQWRTWRYPGTYWEHSRCKNKTKVPLTFSCFSGWSLSGTNSSKLNQCLPLNLISDFFLKKKNNNKSNLCLQILCMVLVVLGLRFWPLVYSWASVLF